MAQAAGAAAQADRAVRRKLIGDIRQLPGQLAVGIGHDQKIPGPGQGHIEHPEFLRQPLRALPCQHRPFGRGGILDPPVQIDHVAAANLKMTFIVNFLCSEKHIFVLC